MVTVYTWLPNSPTVILTEGLMPDLGHSSLLVHDDNGEQEDLYCSFWPEMDSVLRRVINLWKNRVVRFPASYAEDCDEETGFMQRPADFIDHLTGLREDRIRHGWERLKHGDFSVVSWNCANVSECLLIASIERDFYESIQEAVECRLDDLDKDKIDSDEMDGVLDYLAESDLIGCHPEEVHRLAVAYSRAIAEPSKFAGKAGAGPAESEP